MSKKTLTALLITTTVLTGVSYQAYYQAKREAYRAKIEGFYRTYFGREGDAVGIEHWTTWAANKWGIDKVERVGFREAAEAENA
ncbi:MAG: hypothetical protein ACOY3K_02885 [Candidatus Omnitrophota bacterium]